jgi:hypothetical protein
MRPIDVNPARAMLAGIATGETQESESAAGTLYQMMVRGRQSAVCAARVSAGVSADARRARGFRAIDFRAHLTGNQALADINFRCVDRVLLNDPSFVEQNYERLLVAFGSAINQIHIGNKVRGL